MRQSIFQRAAAFLSLIFLADALAFGESLADPAVRIARVVANGQSFVSGAGKPVKLPASAHADVSIEFEPVSSKPGAPARLLYRMDGVDANWQDEMEEMRVTATIYSHVPGDTIIAGFSHGLHGRSPGWTGPLESSKFTEDSESFRTPPESYWLSVVLYSGGPPESTGIFFATDFKLFQIGPGNGRKLVWQGDLNPDAKNTGPLMWRRAGTDLSLAICKRIGGVPALGFIDDRSDRHANWYVDKNGQVVVEPNTQYLLTWKQVYSIGGGGKAKASYHDLAPGRYRFRVSPATVDGLPIGREVALDIEMPELFWKRRVFWELCGALALAAVFGGWRYVEWNRMQLRLARLERERAVERERTRIARDIHDDVGSNLTRIAYLGETLRIAPELSRDKLNAGLDKICTTARAITRVLDEIVWAADPKRDSLESLVAYCGCLAEEVLNEAGVRCRTDFPASLQQPISAEVRHHIFLAFKEALHNISRHAHASEVKIGFVPGPLENELYIADNGCGFDFGGQREPRTTGGHGLANMHERLSALGGRCEIESRAGGGTRVRLIWRKTK